MTIDLSLVKDINVSPEDQLTQIGELTGFGDDVFFTASSQTMGAELWKWNAQRQEASLVKDILPGAGGSNPQNLINVDGTLFFTAEVPQGTCGTTGCVDSGVELWASDGTSEGTRLVKDIVPGHTSSGPMHLTNVDGTLFFVATTDSGAELWSSDGSNAGTQLVKDIVPGAAGSQPAALTNVNGSLFFTAEDDQSGRELWKSDGTALGTQLVKDVLFGQGSGVVGPIASVGEIALLCWGEQRRRHGTMAVGWKRGRNVSSEGHRTRT